jgi:periplasmic divalent cation tolerance protein
MNASHIVIMITVPSREVGEQVANALVEGRLVACVNIVPGISSIYQWQGNIEQEDELLLIAKSRATLFNRVATLVKQIHPYDVPEVIAIPIVAGSSEYLAWIDTETASA